MKFLLIPFFILFLTGCKPPKFNLNVTCPTFQASGVAIYEYSDVGMLYIVYKDYSFAKVEKTECVITPAK